MLNNPFGYNEKLPEKITVVFMWLCQDVVSLQNKWDFFIELFEKKQNTDLLEELAPASFNIIYETLQNDIIMAISRLSDPAKSWGHKHLSLMTLVNRCTEIKSIKKLMPDFIDICKPIRDLRNMRVGHRDLNTAIRPLENPLPGISKEQIDEILKTSVNILNSIVQYYDCSKPDLKFLLTSPGGAKTLIFWLKKGRAHEPQAQ
jgi:hypothetical protein